MLRISASTLRWLYQFLFGTFSCIKAIGLFKLFHIEWGEAVCIFQETGLLYQSCQIYVCRVVLSLPFIIFFKGLWWYLLFHSRSWWSISFLFYFSVLVEVCQFIDLFEEPFLHCFSVLISLISAFIYFLPLSRFFFSCFFFGGGGLSSSHRNPRTQVLNLFYSPTVPWGSMDFFCLSIYLLSVVQTE